MRTYVRYVLLFSFLLFVANKAWSQTTTSTISGVVMGIDELPIPGVNVIASDGNAVATDLDGRYSFKTEVTRPDSVLVTYSFIGYETQKRWIKSASVGKICFQNISLKPAVVEVGTVVVSAGKYEQRVEDLTVSMEVIKPLLVAQKNTTNAVDVLQQVPGVSIVDQEPQIRSGSGYSFGTGSRVAVLVDGLPILSGDAGRPTWGFIPVENISQIEIIKGASSVLYGSAALSGVINFRTTYATDSTERKISLFAGQYGDPKTGEAKYWERNGLQTGLSYAHKQKIKNFDIVGGLYLIADDGPMGPVDTLSDGFNPFKVDRYRAETRGRANLKVNWRSKKLLGLQVGSNFNLQKEESLNTLIWENDSTGMYNALAGAATRTKQLIWTIDPYVEYRSASGFTHTLKTRWQNLDNENDNNQSNFSDVLYSEYQAQWRDEVEKLSITAGIVGTYTKATGTLYTGQNADGGNTASNSAAYLQVDKTFWEKWKVNAGVRWESFAVNGVQESKPVFRAGTNYSIGAATFLRASFGQGFRFPSIAERYIQTGVGAIVIYPNVDLIAETSTNIEFGVKQGFKVGNFKGFADVAVFQQSYKDYVEFIFGRWAQVPTVENLFGIGFRSVNTGDAQVSGAEFSLAGEGKIGKTKISVLGGYTYTEPISLEPDRVFASAPDNGTVGIFSQFENSSYQSTSTHSAGNILKYRSQHLVRFDVSGTRGKIELGASLRYTSAIQNIDSAFTFLDLAELGGIHVFDWLEKQPTGYTVVDARVAFAINRKQRIALVVSNLTNLEYALRPMSIEPPRLVTIKYSLAF